MREFVSQLEAVEEFKAEQIETTFKTFLESKELGLGQVLPNFRLVVTGLGMGPSMFDICEALGKEEVISRISTGIERVEALKASMAS